MKQQRIQRKRTKGWRMPEGAKYCGRPTIWGNPFQDQEDMVYVCAKHRRKILDPWIYYSIKTPKTNAYTLFRDMLMNPNSHEVEPEIRERFVDMRINIGLIQDKDLACFCPLDQPCHCDALLELVEIFDRAFNWEING